MKLLFFIAIILFFAAEFIYENSFLLCVLHIPIFGWFTIILNLCSIKKIVTKKMLSIIIPTLINCGIMKCG